MSIEAGRNSNISGQWLTDLLMAIVILSASKTRDYIRTVTEQGLAAVWPALESVSDE
jgi:hypothetical protein